MLDGEGFDRWADQYDEEVRASETENSYPFAGYGAGLGSIFRIISEKKNATVLDIGFGTGTLTSRLYENGCTVYGQDFSKRMVELASRKMPGAHLYYGDFTKGLVEPLCDMKYDFIVATYSLHHLTDDQKIDFLRKLQSQLNENGRIVIGDVAFIKCSNIQLNLFNLKLAFIRGGQYTFISHKKHIAFDVFFIRFNRNA